MDDRVPAFLAVRMQVHYQVVEPGFLLGGSNPRFWQYLGQEPPPRPVPVADVFPELVGLEDELGHIVASGRGELTIPEVNRASPDGSRAVYFNLSLLLEAEVGPNPIIVLEDTTKRSEFHRRLLQSRNENTLLNDRLLAQRERLRRTARRLARARRTVATQNSELKLLNDEIRRYSHGLETEVRMRTRELKESRLDVIRRLAQASEFRDPETGHHVSRMSRFSLLLARRIGLDEKDCDLLLQASPLHDVGKIAIPDSILLKNGPLSASEWEIMKGHTVHGHRLLAGSTSDLMAAAADIARSHHECWDGSGYPDGARGEAIPLFGRICSLADAFDALTSRRPYKEAWECARAWQELERLAGTAYDPDLYRAFRSIDSDVERIRAQFSEDATDMPELEPD